jgi:hypothetical protein
MRTALAQDPRITRIGETETAVLLGDDQAEEAQVAQPLDEVLGLGRLSIPALEFLVPRREELIDGIEHQPQYLAVLLAQPWIRKEAVFDDSTRQQTLCDAHGEDPIVRPGR